MRQPDFTTSQAVESAFGERRLRRFVTPFYLQLMGVGAAQVDGDVSTKLRKRARGLSSDDVRQMLQMHWRARAMGAWYAIAIHDPSLSAGVHESLETCLGHLTAPPLITASLFYPNERTAAMLRDYIEADLEHQWGAAGFANAALARLAPTNEQPVPVDAMPPARTADIELLEQLVLFGLALRSD